MTEQAKYLLRAPARDMERWKAAAANRGIPFSQHIREALERPVTEDLLREGSERGFLDAMSRYGPTAPVEAGSSTGLREPLSEPASTGDLAAGPAVPPEAGSPSPVASSEGEAGLVQTPARPAAPPEPVIGRADLISEARRLAGRMRR